MTPNAEAFQAANRRSPVVQGAVKGQGGEGAFYTLRNGKTFDLSAQECREIGLIRWVGEVSQ